MDILLNSIAFNKKDVNVEIHLKSLIIRKVLSPLPFNAKNIGVIVCLHFQYMVLPESQLDEIFSYISQVQQRKGNAIVFRVLSSSRP